MSMSGALAAMNPEAAAIQRRRALADRLMAQATQQDFRSPLSIGATVAQSLAGALTGYRADQDEEARSTRQREERQAILAPLMAAMGGGEGGSAPAPAMAASTPSAPPQNGGNDFLARLIQDESGGRPDARNPRSTATGAAQFIDGTWMRFAQANPDRFQGMGRDQILAARNDPNLSREAADWYRRENLAALAAQGLPANDGTAGLAHRFGAAGAASLLRADPNAPIAGIVGQQVMTANPDLANRTAGDVVQRYAQRFGGGSPAPQQTAAPQQQRPDQSAAMRGLILQAAMSDDPALQRLAPLLAQMGAREDRTQTVAPGSFIMRNGQIVGQVPAAPPQPSEIERLIPRWRELSALGERATPEQVAERDILSRRLGGAGVTVNNNTNNQPDNVFNRNLAEVTTRRIAELQPQAQTAAESIRTAQRVQALLNDGVIAGTGAGAREAIERAFVTAGLVDGQRVANTGQLMAELAGATLSAAGGLSGPTSDRDILFLREVVGGNIALTPETIRRIVQVTSDRATRTLTEYNRIAEGIQSEPGVANASRQVFRPIPIPTVDAAAAPRGQQQPQGTIPTPRSMEEMQALPPGSFFRAPDGSLRRVPAR
jgi:hypothetical protein